jgi:hypothetical protein
MAKLDGSCLCGAVTYGSEAEPLATAVCHCTECQKQTGTSFSVIVAVPSDAFRIEGDTLASFTTIGTDTGKEVDRQFCNACGSPIVSFSQAIPGVAMIKAGTLDDSSWLEPTMHVWTESSQSWIDVDQLGENVLPRGLQA